LVLTNGTNRNVYLSGRNMPRVSVLAFDDASAYNVLWSGAVVVEQGALTANLGKGKEASSE
jgi:ribosomal protein L4